MVHTNAVEAVIKPSLTMMPTLYEPVDVGVPEMTPVLGFSVNPNGSPVCENVNGLLSGSVTATVSGVIAVLTVLVRLAIGAIAGIDTATSVEKFPAPLALMARTATRFRTPGVGANTYVVCGAGTVARWTLQLNGVVLIQTS